MPFSELQERVELLLASEGWHHHLTPVLPCSWPPASACAELLSYEARALPTGTIQFRYRGPVSVIRCSLAPLSCSRAAFDGEVDELVEMQATHGEAPDRAAQQTLLDVLQAGHFPEHPPGELVPYTRWLEPEGGLGASVRKRVPEFAAWLRSSQTAPARGGRR